MNITRTQRLLKFCMLGKVPALLVGHSGTGKTQVVGQTAKVVLPEHLFQVLMLSQQDIGDLVGIPNLKELKFKINRDGTKDIDHAINASGDKITSWARPEWMPFEPVVLFLDEFNHASRDVESAAFQLVLEKRIHNHYLHPDSVIIAAVNPAVSEYTTANALSSALVKRFAVIPFQPTADEVLAYGAKNDVFHDQILGYMNFNKNDIGVQKELEIGMTIEPCPRTWEMASNLFKAAEELNPTNTQDIEIVTDILTTVVGKEAAAGYLKFMESQDKPLTFDEVYEAWEANKKRFTGFRKDEAHREDLVSTTVNNVFDGISSLIEPLSKVIKFTGYVNDVDSEDSALQKTRVKEVEENFENHIDKVKFGNILSFLDALPKDYFFQFSYRYMTLKILKESEPVQDNVNKANAHQLILLYLWGNVKGHKNLFSRVKKDSDDIAEYIKSQKVT